MMLDTGYKYNALLIRHDSTPDKGVFLEPDQIKISVPKYKLIRKGANNRFPLWVDVSSNKYIGGIYPDIASLDDIQKLYVDFKRDTQIRGYLETKAGNPYHSENPFPPSLSDGLPRHVWAYAYEQGSRIYRTERRVKDMSSLRIGTVEK
ncbi:hypothetical protein BKG02_004750 [Vibrio parahaemolyticus]|nr:hypothetical protein [Vibrio parahaemolyticus]HCG8016790.1 hypothetical protein [Vibrio parahaemolyticus]